MRSAEDRVLRCRFSPPGPVPPGVPGWLQSLHPARAPVLFSTRVDAIVSFVSGQSGDARTSRGRRRRGLWTALLPGPPRAGRRRGVDVDLPRRGRPCPTTTSHLVLGVAQLARQAAGRRPLPHPRRRRAAHRGGRPTSTSASRSTVPAERRAGADDRPARRPDRRRHRPRATSPTPAEPGAAGARGDNAPSTPSRPSSPAPPTASPTPPPSRWPRRPAAPTTRCSSTARPGWARPTCSRPSPTTCAGTTRTRSSATSRPRQFLNEFVDAIRTNTLERLQAPLPRGRRAAGRRHPVHREGRAASRRSSSTPSTSSTTAQPDRADLRPAARRHRHPRGPAAQPVQDGPDHRHPAARPRDPPRHPPQEGGAGAAAGVRRRARLHRREHHRQHPELEGALIRVVGLRQPLPDATLDVAAGPAGSSPTSSASASPGRSPRQLILDKTVGDVRLHRRGDHRARAGAGRS